MMLKGSHQSLLQFVLVRSCALIEGSSGGFLRCIMPVITCIVVVGGGFCGLCWAGIPHSDGRLVGTCPVRRREHLKHTLAKVRIEEDID